MTYRLGSRSKRRLKRVHPDLVELVEEALKVSEMDFTVLEGVRSRKRQVQLYNQGASTVKGPPSARHCIQEDGYGYAVDLAPLLNGKVSWHWPFYYKLADAMMEASRITRTKIRWGGNWTVHDVSHWDSGQDLADNYKGRFPDGPHWEIPR